MPFKGWGQGCSGAILYEETLKQSTADGKKFVDVLKENGVIPGIKVDKVSFKFDKHRLTPQRE